MSPQSASSRHSNDVKEPSSFKRRRTDISAWRDHEIVNDGKEVLLRMFEQKMASLRRDAFSEPSARSPLHVQIDS